MTRCKLADTSYYCNDKGKVITVHWRAVEKAGRRTARVSLLCRIRKESGPECGNHSTPSTRRRDTRPHIQPTSGACSHHGPCLLFIMSTPHNNAIIVAGEQLIVALEAFVDDADNLVQRDHLSQHIKAMHAALDAFKQETPQKHTAAAGLC